MPGEAIGTYRTNVVVMEEASTNEDGVVTPLRDLVSGGYLKEEDIRGLEHRDVTISRTSDSSRPQDVLIRVRRRGGSDVVMMGDGSIQ